jgi:predicted glycosyltransferase
MRFLIYLGHPAHFHLFRNSIDDVRSAGHQVRIVIKPKDVLEDLLRAGGYDFVPLSKGERADGLVSIAAALARRIPAVGRIAADWRPDLMLGTSVEIGYVGRALGIPSVIVNEDDWRVNKLLALVAYPWADHILAPTTCDNGLWDYKTLKYPGYHELAYLHPSRFEPDRGVLDKLSPDGRPYFLIRFAKLSAYHDIGKTGLSGQMAADLTARLAAHGHVHISSERALEPELEPYRIRIAPEEVHSALAFADIYVGDSQTMAAEAAVLGTPAIRFNDFVGQIGYLEELENHYRLGMGVPTSRADRLLPLVEEVLAMPDRQQVWEGRRQRMLSEKIKVADFLAWFMTEYPSGVAGMPARIQQMLRST